jgi:hypothetical protein
MSKAIITALAKVLPTLENAKKNAANPHFKSKYANLSAVMEAVEPIKAHGLWYRQQSHDKPDGACIETIYMHESGEEMSAGLTFVKADKQNAQGFGSAMTYARRYSLQTAFGLDAEDDDGNAASAPKQHPAPKVETITDAQREELMLLCESLNFPVDRVLTAKKIADLSDLPATSFKGAMKWIGDEAKKMENNNA